MLKARILIGLMLFLGSLFLVWWGVIPLTVEILAIGLVGYYEFALLSRKKGINPSLVIGYIGVSALILSAGLLGEKYLLRFLIAVVFLGLVHFIYRKDFHPHSFFDASVTIFGMIYLGGFLSFILLFRQLPGSLNLGGFILERGAAVLAYIVIINTATDCGSFFIGKYLGRCQLCPNISPGKTVEGSLGGLILAILFSWLLGGFLGLPWYHRIILGALIGVAAQFGDLWESIIKRDVGVKDSSSFLNAHGGVLDRFDSLLFTAPLAFFYWQLFIGG